MIGPPIKVQVEDPVAYREHYDIGDEKCDPFHPKMIAADPIVRKWGGCRRSARTP